MRPLSSIRALITAVLVAGVLVGLVALQRNVELAAAFLFAPVILFPYAVLFLTSRAADARATQVLFLAAVIVSGLSVFALHPNPDAQGGLIVLAIPLLQGAISVGLYVVLRFTGSLRRNLTLEG